MSRSLGFYGNGIPFRVVFSQSFWFRVLPGGTRLAQPKWMPERRILGGGRIRGVSFWPFPNSSSWWWLISSVFLTRTSSRKTTHANGYYGVWPGWAVSVSVLPLTYAPFNYRGSMAHVLCPRNICWSNAVVEQDSSSASWLKSANLFKSQKKYSWTHCCFKRPLYQNEV